MPTHPRDILDAWHDCEPAVSAFNRRIGLAVTNAVGTMWCAYLFALLALLSLPAAVASGSLLVVVGWVAQTFLQLVLLSIILFGQAAQQEKADARGEATYRNSEEIESIVRRIERQIAPEDIEVGGTD
jgi:cobalamin biosynthesis protein CobD/CbiB